MPKLVAVGYWLLYIIISL